MVERSGQMTLATTVALPVLRGPVPLAKALVALDVLSEGRVVAGVGPGSSERDYELAGIPFSERWARFDSALTALRVALEGEELRPGPHRPDGIPLWIGSWGSRAGIARVARAGDGWLASAYNTTPDRFAGARASLARALAARGREADGFPAALATMWTWVTEDRAEADRVLAGTLAPLLRRDPEELREQVCVGSAAHCAELLSALRRGGLHARLPVAARRRAAAGRADRGADRAAAPAQLSAPQACASECWSVSPSGESSSDGAAGGTSAEPPLPPSAPGSPGRSSGLSCWVLSSSMPGSLPDPRPT